MPVNDKITDNTKSVWKPEAKVSVSLRCENRLVYGHPWVYRSDIDIVRGSCSPGDVVDVYGKKRFLGRGYINMQSQIAVRLLTVHDEDISDLFIFERINKAWEYRKKVFGLDNPAFGLSNDESDSYRVVYAESDFLPALIVDKFNGTVVIQTLAFGIDRFRGHICDILQQILKPDAIYERNDAAVRAKEGLELRKGIIRGSCRSDAMILENRLKFRIDLENGQKTGYFLDQRENRAAVSKYVNDSRVLDCFCYTGSFAVHAARYGARSIHGIDISADAVESAAYNAGLNGYSDVCTFEEANVFDRLRSLHEEGQRYDTVILDPPAFAKSRSTLENAARGYKEINLRALKLINSGGFLITCSCSHHMNEALFLDLILEAAADTKRQLRLVELRPHPKDHPVLLALPESRYLKCAVFQVI